MSPAMQFDESPDVARTPDAAQTWTPRLVLSLASIVLTLEILSSAT